MTLLVGGAAVARTSSLISFSCVKNPAGFASEAGAGAAGAGAGASGAGAAGAGAGAGSCVGTAAGADSGAMASEGTGSFISGSRIGEGGIPFAMFHRSRCAFRAT